VYDNDSERKDPFHSYNGVDSFSHILGCLYAGPHPVLVIQFWLVAELSHNTALFGLGSGYRRYHVGVLGFQTCIANALPALEHEWLIAHNRKTKLVAYFEVLTRMQLKKVDFRWHTNISLMFFLQRSAIVSFNWKQVRLSVKGEVVAIGNSPEKKQTFGVLNPKSKTNIIIHFKKKQLHRVTLLFQVANQSSRRKQWQMWKIALTASMWKMIAKIVTIPTLIITIQSQENALEGKSHLCIRQC
jgi:hypothetical protein